MLELELPYPPSINHYWRRVGYRMIISRDGRQFRKRVMAILAAMRIKPLDGDLAVTVVLHPPDRRRRDIDNGLKALLDALQHGGAYSDDSQIVDLHIRRGIHIPGGRVRIRIMRHSESDKKHHGDSA